MQRNEGVVNEIDASVKLRHISTYTRNTFLSIYCPLVVILHVGLIILSSYCALLLRFDGAIPVYTNVTWQQMLPWLVIIRVMMFALFRLYGGVWRYTGIWDLQDIIVAVFISSMAFAALVYWGFGYAYYLYPRSVMIIDTMLLVCLMGGIRLSRRLYRKLGSSRGKKRVLVYGAGTAGEIIVRDMKANGSQAYLPIGFVDDDRTKVGKHIHGVRVLGTSQDLPQIMSSGNVQEVLVAIPRAESKEMRGILKVLEPFNVPLTTLPHPQDILEGRVTVDQIRKLELKDILQRPPVGLNRDPVHRLIAGKRVLVTGAGGSVGSELCRQIAALHPSLLVLFERYENNLYVIDGALRRLNEDQHEEKLNLQCVLGDVTDAERVHTVFAVYQPEIIFHAAAHKHVPLTEENPAEAIRNNIVGTRVVADAAEQYGAERFVMISSDKAVNPTSVMGATKRVGELLIQVMAHNSRTCFLAVRFGNVLGSNGSVVPLFLEQIRAGGPVTVTHPEMRRYFMLIPEAVQLVLHAAALGQRGAVYVLEMGEQIKIVDLARNLIRLSGYIPDEEVPITYIGTRPGEKLYEELIECGETAETSEIEQVLQIYPGWLPEPAFLKQKLDELEKLVNQNENRTSLMCLQELVPTFQSCKF